MADNPWAKKGPANPWAKDTVPAPAPAPKPAPKAKAPEAGFFDKIGEMITAGMQVASPFAPLMRAVNADESRPMSDAERQVVRGDNPRDYASKISEARAQGKTPATTAEMIFPASEAARRADIDAGRTPQGGYASEHLAPFLGDIVSFPSRAGGALGTHGLAALARGLYSGGKQLFTGEKDYSGAGKSVDRVTDWMTDPTGITGSPSGILMFAPGLNTSKIVAKAGERAAAPAAGMLPQVIKSVSTAIAKNPKKATALLRGIEGATTAATGAGLDEFGRPLSHAALGTSAMIGGLGSPLGAHISDWGMEALPGLRQTLNQSAKGVVNKGEKLQAFADTYDMLKRNLKDVGVGESLLGATALENLWRKRLRESGNLYDMVDEAMSPKTRAWLANRGDPKFAEEHIAAGLSPEMAQMFHGRTAPPADIADEVMSWANPEKTVTMQGASPHGPVTMQDIYTESLRKLLGKKEALAEGTSTNTPKELAKELKKKFETISTIMPFDLNDPAKYPISPLFRRDLSAMRNVANVKRGKTIQFGAGDMQNIIGEVVGDFASRHMYGNDLKLKSLGLEPAARMAGKKYKEGKTVQSLVNANQRETTREKTALGKLAAQTAFTEYRLPLLVNALGNMLEKQSARTGASMERNR